MSDPSNNDSTIDKLYKQGATEKPPTSLDQSIREEALANINQSSSSEKKSSIYKWQSIASVAAVMVISVYLFFDVNEMRERQFDAETYAPQPQMSSPSPALEEAEIQPKLEAFDAADSPIYNDEIALEKPVLIEAEGRKQSAVKKERMMLRAPAAKLAPDVSALKEQASLAPEDLLLEIEKHINLGEIDKARDIYEQLVREYPEFEIPESVHIHFREK